jgi:hypothetical protein
MPTSGERESWLPRSPTRSRSKQLGRACGRDGMPDADVPEAVAAEIAALHVQVERVERRAPVRDLRLAVGAPDASEARQSARPGALLDGQGRPEREAGSVGANEPTVPLDAERVEGQAATIDGRTDSARPEPYARVAYRAATEPTRIVTRTTMPPRTVADFCTGVPPRRKWCRHEGVRAPHDRRIGSSSRHNNCVTLAASASEIARPAGCERIAAYRNRWSERPRAGDTRHPAD